MFIKNNANHLTTHFYYIIIKKNNLKKIMPKKYEHQKNMRKESTKRVREAIKSLTDENKPWTIFNIVKITGYSYVTCLRRYRDIKKERELAK